MTLAYYLLLTFEISQVGEKVCTVKKMMHAILHQNGETISIFKFYLYIYNIVMVDEYSYSGVSEKSDSVFSTGDDTTDDSGLGAHSLQVVV